MTSEFSDQITKRQGECLHTPLSPLKTQPEQMPLEIYQKRNMSRAEIKALIRNMRKNPDIRILSINIRRTGE